ncbi:unnamed protein product, partial [Ectocarpus fasciculatus]
QEISASRRQKKQHHLTKPVEWHTPSFVRWFDAKLYIMRDIQQVQAWYLQGLKAKTSETTAARRSTLPTTPSKSPQTPAPVVVKAVKTPAPTTPTKKPSPLPSKPPPTPVAPVRAPSPASPPKRPPVSFAAKGKRQRDGEDLQKPEQTRADRMKAAPLRLRNMVPVPTTTTPTPTATITAATPTITVPTPTPTASSTCSGKDAKTIGVRTPRDMAITLFTAENDCKTLTGAATKVAEVHCCHQPQHENEGWVRVPYLSDEDGGKEVAGAFVHLPVTILPPTCGQVYDEGTVYVRPGGGPPTREWHDEDQRVVWEVAKSSILKKVNLTFLSSKLGPSHLRNFVPAGKGSKCDSCNGDKWGCSWTPDGLELLCNYCADAPRREVGDYRELRGYGQFAWASACDCNC